jgi:hypothetical protein
MKKNTMYINILSCISFFLISSLVLLPATQAQAETLNESTIMYRIYVAYSVDQNAAQAWLPAPWKAVSIPKGPFKGANLYILFNDKLVTQDSEGKPDKGGTYCNVGLVAFGKNQQTGKVRVFVIRVYWPYDDPSVYRNAAKAAVSREATIKDSTSESGSGSEVWKVQDSSGGIMEFRMDYQRSGPKRIKREMKVYSSVEPGFIRIYRDDYASDLVKSIPLGMDKVKNYHFRTTISELRKMFNGSEKLVGISVNPCRVRQAFLP